MTVRNLLNIQNSSLKIAHHKKLKIFNFGSRRRKALITLLMHHFTHLLAAALQSVAKSHIKQREREKWSVEVKVVQQLLLLLLMRLRLPSTHIYSHLIDNHQESNTLPLQREKRFSRESTLNFHFIALTFTVSTVLEKIQGSHRQTRAFKWKSDDSSACNLLSNKIVAAFNALLAQFDEETWV